MRLTFLGGTETVTGSKFLLESGKTKVLIDCGLYQGYKWLRKRNREPLPLDINSLDAVILTHAHLDHSGYIPALYKQGYRGPIFTHEATISLCSILLPDSGHIQEEDARFYGRHKISKHAHPEALYTREEAEACLKSFKPLKFKQQKSVGDIKFHLQGAGHILGAASIIIECEGKTIGFSGDVGRPNDIIMYPPEPLPALDLLMLESTYGNRRHESADPYEQLAGVVNKAAHKGGALLIPSFAVGRTETIQHMLATLMADNRIPRLPVYLDSPMAINVFDIYCEFDEIHRLNSQQCQVMSNLVEFVRDTESSKALADIRGPHIIIAGSGMATGGRILHHLKRLISDHRTTVLFTGFLSGGTRGAKMLQGADQIKIHGQWIPVKATIEALHGLSGHADYKEIADWLSNSDLAPKTRIQLIHGEPEASEAMRDYLLQTSRFDVDVAGYKNILKI